MEFEQTTLFPPAEARKGCFTCKYFSELKVPRERSDGAVIYGYCFKDGDKSYSINMGKGYPVFLPLGGGSACKMFKRRSASSQRMMSAKTVFLTHAEAEAALESRCVEVDAMAHEQGKKN